MNSSTNTRPSDLSRLAIHTITTKPWSLEEACGEYAARGIPGISVWVEAIENRSASDVRRLIDSAGLKVPALVRGGFFCDTSQSQRQLKIERNRRLIETAAEIGAEMLVLVVGAVPGVPLQTQRGWVNDGVEQLVGCAEQHSVQLAIEPLHPMYAGDRSCVTSLRQARNLCERIDHRLVGVALDVYHVWWDEDLEREIQLLGDRKELFAFHLCDWRCPTRDLLNDRALMGDGCIDLAGIRHSVHAAGFDGWEEVEIFSDEHWARDQGAFVDQIIDRYRGLLAASACEPD
ncbi:MAG: sugar phosphate isomerase/epimerase family protein [Planctomycetaceae bacterium]